MYRWIPAVYCLPPSNIPFLTFKHFDTWNAINTVFLHEWSLLKAQQTNKIKINFKNGGELDDYYLVT